MVKKKQQQQQQQQQLGFTLTSLFSSSSKDKEDNSTCTSASSAGLLLCASSSSSSSISMSSSSWQWPSCKQPRTLSFRRHPNCNDSDPAIMKTMNSAYFPDSADSCSFSNSLDDDTLSTASDADEADAVLRALRSGRLFFEPDDAPASRLTKKKMLAMVAEEEEDDGKKQQAAFDGATAMCMESAHPYREFRASMEAMVMSRGGGGSKDWRWLEEMLGWYLRANAKTTHGLIVAAFVDLLVALTTPSAPTDNCCSSSPSSSACSSFRGIAATNIDEIKEEAA